MGRKAHILLHLWHHLSMVSGWRSTHPGSYGRLGGGPRAGPVVMPSTLGLAEGVEDTIHILPVPCHDVEALVRPALCPLSMGMVSGFVLRSGVICAASAVALVPPLQFTSISWDLTFSISGAAFAADHLSKADGSQ